MRWQGYIPYTALFSMFGLRSVPAISSVLHSSEITGLSVRMFLCVYTTEIYIRHWPWTRYYRTSNHTFPHALHTGFAPRDAMMLFDDTWQKLFTNEFVYRVHEYEFSAFSWTRRSLHPGTHTDITAFGVQHCTIWTGNTEGGGGAPMFTAWRTPP